MNKARAFLSVLTAIIAVASAVIVVCEKVKQYKKGSDIREVPYLDVAKMMGL